jgi:glutamyl-tRNA synthetase
MKVITRFAPSPTGYLHIGGARTALFNWYFTKHHQGKFCLRIEDTDRERSTQGAIDAILQSLSWLELGWDGDVVFQSKQIARHQEVAHQLLANGHAYYCTCKPQELDEMRTAAQAAGKPTGYNGKCRDKGHTHGAVRLKGSQEDGHSIIEDLVQGTVKVAYQQLDDMVLLRSDGTPTYMLSVVVDDHDMDITHIIRGDDHLTNAFRQKQIYEAMGWTIPVFAHIPLIHGPDGAKLSKRHGATSADSYRDMGYLPEAMRNYLLRLGWGHGDEEIISDDQAIEWFSLDKVGRSPSRFDLKKLDNLNAHYLRLADNQRLVSLIQPRLETIVGHALTDLHVDRLLRGMNGLKERARTVVELADNAVFYVRDQITPVDEKAAGILTPDARTLLAALGKVLESHGDWTEQGLEDLFRQYADQHQIKLGLLAQPVRVALTGSTISPSIFDIMVVLGSGETLGRLKI